MIGYDGQRYRQAEKLQRQVGRDGAVEPHRVFDRRSTGIIQGRIEAVVTDQGDREREGRGDDQQADCFSETAPDEIAHRLWQDRNSIG